MHLIILFLAAILPQPGPLYIISPDFPNEGSIPPKFTCDGENTNPTLIVNGIPEGTASLVLIAEDPDAHRGESASQWLVWNIPPSDRITENIIQNPGTMKTVERKTYSGPCPSDGSVQRYAFKVFALDTLLSLESNASRHELEKAMAGRILANGELLGEYSRSVMMGSSSK